MAPFQVGHVQFLAAT